MENHFNDNVLDNLLEGFQLIDFQWRYLYVNESVAKQGKSSKDELIGQTMMAKYPGIEKTKLFQTLERCMQSRVAERMENEFTYPDGLKGWFELRIEPVSEGLFILSIDITERKKAEEELRSLNEQLEEKVALRTTELEIKNKELTDSIRCAKRIQRARLPSKDEIKAILPNSFILFKPKAIVSGDFYYLHKKDSRVYLASADCTGHGVPGALMSMLCSAKLHDAVLQFGHPSEILEEVNRVIKTSLRHSNSYDDIRDGMDIALCCVNTETHTLRYAGANRPLWLIQKGSREVKELKGTRRAIGGFTDNNQQFDSCELRLAAGDTIYMFSDGYTDLFDSEDKEKISTKRFREILLSIQELTMEEQKLFLSDFADDWRKETEQIDDILVIGVRF